MNPFKTYFIIIKTLLYFWYDSVALWKTPCPQKNHLEVVLLIRQDAIGDFVMWLDTAKEYRKLYHPINIELFWWVMQLWFDLAKGLPYWDEILLSTSNNSKLFPVIAVVFSGKLGAWGHKLRSSLLYHESFITEIP